MCRMRRHLLPAVAALLVSVAPALAHHSNSAFQVDKVIELKGVVT